MCYNIIKVKEQQTNKIKQEENKNGEYVIEKESGKYYLYINGAKYSETKTLKTAKKYADEHFRESPKKYLHNLKSSVDKYK